MKRFVWRILGIVLLALATVWGSLWMLHSEIRPHTIEESMERFPRFAQEANAILDDYGLDTEKNAIISVVEPTAEESGCTAIQVCVPLEGGYQLYYSLDNDDWRGEAIWCKLISPLKDSAMETAMDLKDVRFAPFFEVAAYLTNTYSARWFNARAITQQRRLFRYVKNETEEVENSYHAYDAESLVMEDPAYEHEGWSCVHEEKSWSYCLGVWVYVDCYIYQYKNQYYSTVEIMSELNRS